MSALIPIVGTLLAAFVAAALSIRSYRNQKEIDRRNDLRKQQRTAYEIYAKLL